VVNCRVDHLIKQGVKASFFIGGEGKALAGHGTGSMKRLAGSE
jgi:hypothetical protein